MTPRVAIVHDWLCAYAGSERVLQQMLLCFPHADLFSLIDYLPAGERAFLGDRPVTTSFIQHLPLSRRHYQKYLPLMPAAIESLDLRGYDLVLSSTSGIAKGVLTEPDQLHICYLQSRSLRYLYDERFAYGRAGALGLLQDIMVSRVRAWDAIASRRPQHTIANSDFVRHWHRHRHGIDCALIHPPVDVGLFGEHYSPTKDDYYITVSRLEGYKKVSVIVEAFNRIGSPLLVIGAGSEDAGIRRLARGNIRLLGSRPSAEVARLVSKAKAFVFVAREDFGIAPVEAQACGTPVIAYGCGGVRETVRVLGEARPTGIFFDAQTPEALVEAVATFETAERSISPIDCRHNAQRFSAPRFRAEFSDFVCRRWEEFGGSPAAIEAFKADLAEPAALNRCPAEYM